MKKSLLLLAAIAVAATASAQLKSNVATSKNRTLRSTAVAAKSYTVESATMATSAERAALKAKRVATKAAPKAWYNRPAGAFYRSVTSSGGAFYNPVVYAPSNREVTWTGACLNADQVKFGYSAYNSETKAYDSTVVAANSFTHSFLNGEGMYAPEIDAIAAGAVDHYTLFNNYYNSTTKETATYRGITYYLDDPRADFELDGLDCYLSPKFWAAGVREQTTALGQGGGMVYLTGAKDADGGTSGCWFGKNAAGWNGVGLYVEKPASAYALRGLHVYYAAENVKADCPVVAKIYACTKTEETDAETAQIVLGDLLYTAKGTIPAAVGEVDAFVDLPLIAEEDGIEYEVYADVDQELFIVFSGYENIDATMFSTMVTKDWCDEGFGQHGYMTPVDANGEPQDAIDLREFFTVSLGYTAPSVFMDVEWPLLVWNYNFEDGVYNFPAAGGDLERKYATYSWDYLSIYSSKTADELLVSTEDGEDLPEWLSYELVDVVEDGELTGEIELHMNAQALPEGEKYRECNVKIGVPGATLVAQISQGEKPSVLPGDINEDGVVNVSDVTCLVNKILGEADYSDEVCDINKDGVVNVSDVTALISMILGE